MGTYPSELKAESQRGICALIFMAVLWIHSIHNSQKVEGTQVSIDWWMDRQNVVYTYNGIFFSLKEKGSSDIRMLWHMLKKGIWKIPWGHYAKWNRSVKKDEYSMIVL